MRLLILALLIICVLTGCEDKGKCLRSHPESVYIPTYITQCPMKGVCVTTPIGGYTETNSVCDAWEFPEGRPAEDKKP